MKSKPTLKQGTSVFLPEEQIRDVTVDHHEHMFLGNRLTCSNKIYTKLLKIIYLPSKLGSTRLLQKDRFTLLSN